MSQKKKRFNEVKNFNNKKKKIVKYYYYIKKEWISIDIYQK